MVTTRQQEYSCLVENGECLRVVDSVGRLPSIPTVWVIRLSGLNLVLEFVDIGWGEEEFGFECARIHPAVVVKPFSGVIAVHGMKSGGNEGRLVFKLITACGTAIFHVPVGGIAA